MSEMNVDEMIHKLEQAAHLEMIETGILPKEPDDLHGEARMIIIGVLEGLTYEIITDLRAHTDMWLSGYSEYSEDNK